MILWPQRGFYALFGMKRFNFADCTASARALLLPGKRVRVGVLIRSGCNGPTENWRVRVPHILQNQNFRRKLE